MDYAVHWALEALGGGACACATRYCPHRLQAAMIWLLFSMATTYSTVQLVG